MIYKIVIVWTYIHVYGFFYKDQVQSIQNKITNQKIFRPQLDHHDQN